MRPALCRRHSAGAHRPAAPGQGSSGQRAAGAAPLLSGAAAASGRGGPRPAAAGRAGEVDWIAGRAVLSIVKAGGVRWPRRAEYVQQLVTAYALQRVCSGSRLPNPRTGWCRGSQDRLQARVIARPSVAAPGSCGGVGAQLRRMGGASGVSRHEQHVMGLWPLLSTKLRGFPLPAASLVVAGTYVSRVPSCSVACLPLLQYAAARVGAVLVNLNPSLKAAGARLVSSPVWGQYTSWQPCLMHLTHACSPGSACRACCRWMRIPILPTAAHLLMPTRAVVRAAASGRVHSCAGTRAAGHLVCGCAGVDHVRLAAVRQAAGQQGHDQRVLVGLLCVSMFGLRGNYLTAEE